MEINNIKQLIKNIINFSNNNYTKKLLRNKTNFLELSLEDFKTEILTYVDSLKVRDYEYKFSKSSEEPTLYSSVYACMIKGLFNDISLEEKKGWEFYFDGFQNENGFFIEKKYNLDNFMKGDNWGARHLIPHMIIAYGYLDAKPKKNFKFIQDINTPLKITNLLETLDFNKIWGSSNTIMNYGVILQYSRDYLKISCEETIEAMENWLLKNINKKYGMWYEENGKRIDFYEMIRGAYHIYPIFNYDNLKIPYALNTIEIIKNSQNKWGGFDKNIGSTACDDIDAIELLIRLCIQEKINSKEIKEILEKSLKWIFANKNEDGGFVFSRRGSFKYGNENFLSSKNGESNLFATWFRTLSVLYIYSYLGIWDINFLSYPGYEYPINKGKRDGKLCTK